MERECGFKIGVVFASELLLISFGWNIIISIESYEHSRY